MRRLCLILPLVFALFLLRGEEQILCALAAQEDQTAAGCTDVWSGELLQGECESDSEAGFRWDEWTGGQLIYTASRGRSQGNSAARRVSAYIRNVVLKPGDCVLDALVSASLLNDVSQHLSGIAESSTRFILLRNFRI